MPIAHPNTDFSHRFSSGNSMLGKVFVSAEKTATEGWRKLRNKKHHDFAAWTIHFLMLSKRPTNTSLIQCIGASMFISDSLMIAF
jgi:hypothetical protein